jgi:subtilisin family serine protease
MRGLGAVLSAAAVLGFPGAVTASPADPSYVPGELLVRFAPTATTAARADILDDLDAEVAERLPLSGLVRVRLDHGTSVQEAAAAFERRAGVRFAHANHIYRVAAAPNDPKFVDGTLWGMTKIEAPTAWDTTTGSNAVTVAVVDTGIDDAHPDLAANMWTNGSGHHGRDFVNDDDDPFDDHGHGTHVAGTIGAVGNNSAGVVGVNWQVKVMALKAANPDGSGGAYLTEEWIVEAFQYACANGAKVVNGSFGGSDGDAAMLAAITNCPGALFVFAAGNEGTNNDALPQYPCNFPAPNVVCVAASDQSDARASFSNYGVSSVDLAAPGVDVYSTTPGGYGVSSGTSMATPHVAGAAALVLASDPALSVAAVRSKLLLSGDPRAGFTGIIGTGSRLNVRRALSQEVVLPTGLTGSSSSPSFNAWSNVNTATAAWGGATDASGIDGYSYAWSPDTAFVPDEVKDVEENVTSSSATLPDGRNWFHVRVRDGAGNWSDTVHVGPFLVDTFPPARPTLSSPTHRGGVASTDRTVEINWTTLGDSVSGLDGFSVAWGRQQLVTVDQTKELEEGVFRTTSARLDNGAWWFGIRARDNAGNWTEATVLGPFVITGTSPVCVVPRLRGLTLAVAKRSLARKGCALGRVTKAYSRRVRRGKVIGQKPAPGLRLRRGAKVAVVLSRGRRR